MLKIDCATYRIKQLVSCYRHLSDTVVCVNEYISYCLNPELHKQYKAMISGTTLLIEKLCKPNSTFRYGKFHLIPIQ